MRALLATFSLQDGRHHPWRTAAAVLAVMLGVALVMVPIVLAYQFWMYRLFSAPVTHEDLKDDHAY